MRSNGLSIVEGSGRGVTSNFKLYQFVSALYGCLLHHCPIFSSPFIGLLVLNSFISFPCTSVPYLETSTTHVTSRSTTNLTDSIAYIFLKPIPSHFLSPRNSFLTVLSGPLLSTLLPAFRVTFQNAFQILKFDCVTPPRTALQWLLVTCGLYSKNSRRILEGFEL